MKITVAGVGYVGLSLAVLMAQHHEVMAVTTTPSKAEKLNQFISPIQDEEIERFIVEAKAGKRKLNLTTTCNKEVAYALFWRTGTIRVCRTLWTRCLRGTCISGINRKERKGVWQDALLLYRWADFRMVFSIDERYNDVRREIEIVIPRRRYRYHENLSHRRDRLHRVPHCSGAAAEGLRGRGPGRSFEFVGGIVAAGRRDYR